MVQRTITVLLSGVALATAMLGLGFETTQDGLNLTGALAATAPVICQSGFQYNRAQHACIRTLRPTCDAGYAWDQGGKRCVSTERPRQSCPSGYHLVSQGSACAPNSSGAPPAAPGAAGPTIPPTCPSGFRWSASAHRCMSVATRPGNCPSGYSFSSSSGLCVDSRTASCPGGYHLDVAHGVCSTGSVAQ